MAAAARLDRAVTSACGGLWRALALGLVLTGCASTGGGTLSRDRVTAPDRETASRSVPAPTPAPPRAESREQVGKASWYGKVHQGRTTASGEVYDMYDLTAAHRTLPMGARVQVTNVENGRRVVVRINDRGPIVRGRIIDLSYAAAQELDAVSDGTVNVRIRVLSGPSARASPESLLSP